MVGFVGINDTLLLQILTGRPELIRVIEYMCFVFLPFPALSFFSSTTGDSHSKLSSGMFVACLLTGMLNQLTTMQRILNAKHGVNITFTLIPALLPTTCLSIPRIQQALSQML